jgi:hypothetical protein
MDIELLLPLIMGFLKVLENTTIALWLKIGYCLREIDL